MRQKTVFLCIAILCLLCLMNSCKNDEFDYSPYTQSGNLQVVDSFYVPYETALFLAEQVFVEQDTITRGVKKKRKVGAHYEYVVQKTTRSVTDGEEIRFHVINFENDEGFVIVAADSRTTPVYAFSPVGNLVMDAAVDNPGFAYFLESAVEYYVGDINFDIPLLPAPDTCDIPYLALEEVDGVMYHIRQETSFENNLSGILLDVSWNQNYPYNYYCGENEYTGIGYGFRNAAGCGPIAAAQIMSYYRFPSYFDGYDIEWDTIMSSTYENERYSYNTECSYSARNLARLINLIGIESYAIYGSQTSVFISDVDDMFRTFGYQCSDPVAFSQGVVSASINRGEPVFIGGTSPEGGGHAWVIDGYKRQRTDITYYYTTPPYNIYKKNTEYGKFYYHCNWGWGENDNYAVWCLDVFSPYDGKNYNLNNQIIHSIKPANL